MGSVTTQRNTFAGLEGLEDRRLMSAGLSGPAGRVWDDLPTAAPVVMSVRSPSIMKTASSLSKRYPQAVAWTGTCKTAGSTTATGISMTITTQKNGSATGSFSLGPISGNKTVTSIAQVSSGSDHGFRVVLQGSGFIGSITGAMSQNGKQVMGRWACNGPDGWKTGTFVMNMK